MQDRKSNCGVRLLMIFLNGIGRAQPGPLKITGSVFDPSGFTVARARIQVDSAWGVRLTDTTDKDGRFSILWQHLKFLRKSDPVCSSISGGHRAGRIISGRFKIGDESYCLPHR